MNDDNRAVDPTAQTGPEEGEEQPTLLEQMGGISGLVSSTLPILVLVPVNNAYGLLPALGAALGVALLIFVWRLVRKENLQPAVSGLMGVGIGAAIAWWTGDAKGYFLYGIWMSLLFFVLALGSVLIRWPLVGVIWKGITGAGMGWRENIIARRAYGWSTLGWAVVFLSRFIVQNSFYNADDTTALAVARILMGWPLTGVVTLFTIFMVRRANRAIEAEETGTSGTAATTGPSGTAGDTENTDHTDDTADAVETGGRRGTGEAQADPDTGAGPGQENRP